MKTILKIWLALLPLFALGALSSSTHADPEPECAYAAGCTEADS